MDDTTGPPDDAAEATRRIAEDVAVELERAEALEAAADETLGSLELLELGYYEAELQSLRHALRPPDGERA